MWVNFHYRCRWCFAACSSGSSKYFTAISAGVGSTSCQPIQHGRTLQSRQHAHQYWLYINAIEPKCKTVLADGQCQGNNSLLFGLWADSWVCAPGSKQRQTASGEITITKLLLWGNCIHEHDHTSFSLRSRARPTAPVSFSKLRRCSTLGSMVRPAQLPCFTACR